MDEPCARDRSQLRLRRIVRRDDRLGPIEQRVHQLVEHAEQQLLLALDVVVEAAAREPAGGDEVVDRGRVVAALGEQACGRVDDLLPARVVAGAQRGTGRRGGRRHDSLQASEQIPTVRYKFTPCSPVS